MTNIYISISLIICGIIISFLSPGCSTGIESTKTITASRHDRRQLAPSAEDTLMNAISLPPLGKWQKYREFLVTDDKALLIYNIDDASLFSDSLSYIKGKHLRYSHSARRLNPGGISERIIILTDGKRNYSYPTGKTPIDADSSFTPLDLPMLIDLGIVEETRKHLTGRKLWTLSSLRYDKAGDKLPGKRFTPVTVRNVTPGDSHFPLYIQVDEADGTESIIYMSIRNTGMESRTFPSLFSLSDPKVRFSSISDEVWDLIQQGKVKQGMTKDECRLALGNPDDVNAGHDWSRTIDLWSYRNGVFLEFQDGLLVFYRL